MQSVIVMIRQSMQPDQLLNIWTHKEVYDAKRLVSA